MARRLRMTAGRYLAAAGLLTAATGVAAINLGDVMNYVEKGTRVVTAVGKATKEFTPENEHYIGRAVAADILGRYKPLTDPKRVAYINNVGGYLALHSTRPETYGGYHFTLLDTPEINAFAAPGGFIFVTRGLYEKLQTEEQLAAVLAHEIAHVTLKHGMNAIKEKNKNEALMVIAEEVISEVKGGKLREMTNLFKNTVGDIVKQLVESGYSQTQESAADEQALRIVYRAGYDPRGLAEFLDILNQGKPAGGHGTGLYKTHPGHAERLVEVERQIASEQLNAASDSVRDARFAAFAMR